MNPQVTIDAHVLELMLRAGSRWVLWLLLGLSVAAVSVMLERLWFFVQERRPQRTLAAALAALRAGGPKAALTALGEARSMHAALARACLARADEGPAAAAEHISATFETERLRYERGLAFLGTLGANAPFIGLFGTVLGIIRAFHDLAAASAVQGTQAVMAGIAEALVATGIGLLVALPAVAAYNAFARHVEAQATSANALGHELLGLLKSERTSEGTGAAQPSSGSAS